jgi:hypothetical protein
MSAKTLIRATILVAVLGFAGWALSGCYCGYSYDPWSGFPIQICN